MWETQNKLTKHFQIIWPVACSYSCTTRHSPAVNRKVWSTRLVLRPCSEHCGSYVSSRCKLDQKRHCALVIQAGAVCVGHTGRCTVRWSYKPVHRVTKPITQRWHEHKQTHNNVLLLRNVAWYSVAGADVCNWLNRTDIGTANVKYSPGQHTKYKLQE
jgi:hypothetical protein